MQFDVEAIQHRILPPTEPERARARERLESLSRPRLTGSEGATEVDATLRAELEKLGYEVKELRFTFSAAPGRYAVSAAGAVFALGILIALLSLLRHNGLVAILVLLLTGAAVAAIAYWTPRAVAKMKWRRQEAANWLVHRPGARPRYIVVAHRDSKSQLLPTSLRVVAIVAGVAAWLVLLVISLFTAANRDLLPIALVWLFGIVALAAGLALAACVVGNASPGALDNGTGLATVLGLAEHERETDDIAFLLTDAEELVLAGASAVARSLPPVAGIINLDILDDEGEFQIVERFGYPRRGLAPHLAAALMTAAHALGLPARRRDLPPGVMVDHMAFTDAGLPSVTLHRGTNATFRRVHRPTDDVSRLNGSGVAAAVAVLVGALQLLRESTTGS